MTCFPDVTTFMSMPTPTTVEVNGFAAREIRIRSGIEVAALAEQIGVNRSYIAKIELGHSPRVSATVFEKLRTALAVQDRRALLANPRGQAA